MMIYYNLTFWKLPASFTSYSFHCCAEGVSYICSPVKETLLPPPDQSHSRSSVWKCRSQQTLLTACPQLPGMSHIRQSLDSALLDRETMENVLWKLQCYASWSRMDTSPHLIIKNKQIIYLALHLNSPCCDSTPPSPNEIRDAWRPLARQQSYWDSYQSSRPDVMHVP